MLRKLHRTRTEALIGWCWIGLRYWQLITDHSRLVKFEKKGLIIAVIKTDIFLCNSIKIWFDLRWKEQWRFVLPICNPNVTVSGVYVCGQVQTFTVTCMHLQLIKLHNFLRLCSLAESKSKRWNGVNWFRVCLLRLEWYLIVAVVWWWTNNGCEVVRTDPTAG